MAGKRLKKDRIMFMNSTHDNLYATLGSAGIIISGIGFLILAYADKKRWTQVEVYTGKDEIGDETINDAAMRFKEGVE